MDNYLALFLSLIFLDVNRKQTTKAKNGTSGNSQTVKLLDTKGNPK